MTSLTLNIKLISLILVVCGLNICKNISAIKAGVVLSEEAKQKVIRILKENADPRLFGQ